MISTAIRTAVPRSWGAHHGCGAATGGCGRAEVVKRYSKRRALAEEAAQGMAEAAEKAEVARPAARVCVDCGTSETPLWRSGPQGPKSLCNACGIKYRKRRRALGAPHGTSASKGEDGKVLSTEELKKRQREKQERMLKLLVLQHQQQRRSKMEEKAAAEAGKEVEEAALLLMSLSSGLFVHS